ncbi:hypothetical protein [Aneurinibacillus aneurinilyticus]|uniref:hypothetical protein n=1 Tax=Aneurinibacillus aneurinilyticus TaxID=1391 RepID=UPI003523C8D5
MMMFYEETETTVPQLLLACNAVQQENWLAGLLGDFEECGRVKDMNELNETLEHTDTVHLAVLLRKNRHGGVEKVEEMARLILEHSPQARVLIIVGANDKRGKEIVQAVQELPCRTLLANGPKSPITGEAIQEEVLSFAEAIRQEQEEQSDSEHWIPEEEEQVEAPPILRKVFVEGVKGGSGCTTAITMLARMLHQKGQPVHIFDPTGGCNYTIDEHESIPVHQARFEYPADGWVVIDGVPPEDWNESEEHISHVLIADSSREALVKVQERIRPYSLLVINRTLTEIPNEVYEQETKQKPDVYVVADPYTYIMKEEGRMLADWAPLLEKLEAM